MAILPARSLANVHAEPRPVGRHPVHPLLSLCISHPLNILPTPILCTHVRAKEAQQVDRSKARLDPLLPDRA